MKSTLSKQLLLLLLSIGGTVFLVCIPALPSCIQAAFFAAEFPVMLLITRKCWGRRGHAAAIAYFACLSALFAALYVVLQLADI